MPNYTYGVRISKDILKLDDRGYRVQDKTKKESDHEHWFEWFVMENRPGDEEGECYEVCEDERWEEECSTELTRNMGTDKDKDTV